MHAGDPRAEGVDQGRADAEHHLAAVHQGRQPLERFANARGLGGLGQVEVQVAGDGRHPLEDAGLEALGPVGLHDSQERRFTPGSSQA